MQKEIGRIKKSNLEVLVVSLSEYKGKQLFDVRQWAAWNGDEHKPTQKGVSMPIESLREFKAKVDELWAVACGSGLVK
ncbi:MAG: transcriptional coactivator p15/PC4 family protein [Nitrospira sp.]